MDKPHDSSELLSLALQAIDEKLRTGRLSKALPHDLSSNSQFDQILSDLETLYQFTLATANGDLAPKLHLKGAMAGSLKTLQANLRHLTWQTQQVAQGDFTQRVDFMGDFSEAFNSMVSALDEAMTQLERREAELSESNTALRREIEERIKAEEALRERTAELEVSNAELDAFAHTVAHDLKNPLGTITSYSQLLTGSYELSDTEIEQFLGIIEKTGFKMVNIVDELLLLASVRRGEEVTMSRLDMGRIVEESLMRLHGMTKEYQANVISPDEWPVVYGYGPWIEEVWMNYISNAIKYGGQPPRVELGAGTYPARFADTPGMEYLSAKETVAVDMDNKEQISFWVCDNGPGLAPEEQSNLFLEFSRLDRIGTEGHGLGLSIVRRIIEKLGGKVGVKSQTGTGSLFYFTLPSQVNY